MRNWDQEIAEAASEAFGAFALGELAYLALTSKIEHPIRDRMAFYLHSKFSGAGSIVAREWKRVDLAVIASDGKPSCLVELKACYTFDALEKEPWFLEPVSSDLVKIAR